MGSTPIPLYRMSSQHRNWMFTPEDLANARMSVNEAGAKRIRALIEEDKAAREQEQLNGNGVDSNNHDSNGSTPTEVEYLLPEDEYELIDWYLEKITQLGNAFDFSESVQATAITYTKRFYIYNTCMDYHPKLVILTCLFLASKTENQVMSINRFVDKVKNTSPQDVLDLEFPVSQSLRFQYKVHHAHTAAYGIYLDMLIEKHAPPGQVHSAYMTAKKLVTISRYTDLEFHYSPSQIATAAFTIADSELIQSWLHSKSSKMSSPSNPSSPTKNLDVDHLLHSCIQDITETILKRKQKTFSKDEITNNIGRKLRSCANPAKDPNSALHRKRVAEEEQRDLEKRQAKRQLSQSQLLDDPFQ